MNSGAIWISNVNGQTVAEGDLLAWPALTGGAPCTIVKGHRMFKTLTLVTVVIVAGAMVRPRSALPGAVVIVGARVWTSPDAPVLPDATVVVSDGLISTVGERRSVDVPANAHVIDGAGRTLVAGFWNCHVHFSDGQWDGAALLPPERLSQQLTRMLTRYGFTTAVDTGSLLENTLALRRRIESGEVAGPRIFTAGEPFVAKAGTPYYIRPILLPELLTVAQTRDAVRDRLEAGADAIKLHAGAIIDRERDLRTSIPLDLVRAATEEAHRLGKPVLAHPQDVEGLTVSVDGGVDVLLHVTELMDRWPADLLSRAVERRMALVPTLKLLAGLDATEKQANLLRQVREFRAGGGDVLFGTDVGYLPDHNPEAEYVLMERAGMNAADVLRSLTTSASRRFTPGTRAGMIADGFVGDLVLLDGDPEHDIRHFAHVRAAIRAGRIVFERPESRTGARQPPPLPQPFR